MNEPTASAPPEPLDPIAADLIAAGRDAGALAISTDPPFRWASGAMMPVYTDTRRLIATPRGRAIVRRGLRALVAATEEHYDAVAGTASAGIAPATLLAEDLACPLYYVRSAAKDHGRGRRIEGMPDDGLAGLRVILVEDLISTGGSSAAAAEALIDAGATVVACVAVFSYGFAAATDRFRQLPGAPPVRTIATVRDLIAAGENEGWLEPGDAATIRDWEGDPFGWYRRTAASGDAVDKQPELDGGTPAADAATNAAADAATNAAADAATNAAAGRAAGLRMADGAPAAADRAGRVLRDSARRAGHLLCVGLDPRPDLLPPGIPVADFLAEVVREIATAGPPPAAVKPNVAFFAQLDRPRDGAFAGSRALATVLAEVRRLLPGVPVILDAKRGDIAATSAAYAGEAFQSWGADAVTVSPFMGDDSVEPFLAAAADDGVPRWVYLLNRTSNAGARRFQNQPTGSPPRPIFETVATAIQEWQARYGTAGAVIGATAPAELRALLRLHRAMPLPVLVPGVGAQGGSAAEVVALIRDEDYPRELVRINASRQVVFPWAGDTGVPSGWRGAIRTAYRRLAEEAAWR